MFSEKSLQITSIPKSNVACELLTIIIILSIHHGALIYHNLHNFPETAETTFKF